MDWVEVLPEYGSAFRDVRWDSAASFLSWTGIVVNRHSKRTVEQVYYTSPTMSAAIGGDHAVPSPPAPLPEGEGRNAFFLKKESGVRFRDRFRNAWHGFGWCSTAVREGAILQAAQRAGIGCPEVAALGEAGQDAFVLTRDESHMPELRTYLAMHDSGDTRLRLADALGCELAKMHDAGFDHPDLFAKHILVSEDLRFCILDWQRARWRKSVSWRLRTRDLALLDATLHDALASDRLRLRCLRAYLRAATQRDAPPLARIARSIRHESIRLRTARNICEIGQLPINEKEQQFVQLSGGRLQVVRSYHEECGGRLPRSDPEAQARDIAASLACASGSAGMAQRVSFQSTRLASHAVNDREFPPLAHTLFRLQRFGVSAPRLIAVCWSATHVHVFMRAPFTMSFDEACAKASPSRRGQLLQQAGTIVRQIHEAGYSLPFGESWAHRLGVNVTTGKVVLHRAEPMERRSAPWQEFAPTELNHQEIRLSRTDRLRFLSGYLRQTRGKRHGRASLVPLFKSTTASRERQAVG